MAHGMTACRMQKHGEQWGTSENMGNNGEQPPGCDRQQTATKKIAGGWG